LFDLYPTNYENSRSTSRPNKKNRTLNKKKKNRTSKLERNQAPKLTKKVRPTPTFKAERSTSRRLIIGRSSFRCPVPSPGTPGEG